MKHLRVFTTTAASSTFVSFIVSKYGHHVLFLQVLSFNSCTKASFRRVQVDWAIRRVQPGAPKVAINYGCCRPNTPLLVLNIPLSKPVVYYAHE
jgi:hypothetical protein